MSDYRLDIEVSQDNALKNLDALARKLNEVNSAGNSTSQVIERTGSAGSTASRGLNLLTQTGSNAGIGMMKLEKSSNDLNASLGILTKSVLSYELAARAISASDAYLGMQNRLKLVTDSEKELQIAMQDTFEISQKTGSVWSTNVQIYQRFMDVSDKLGKSQAEIGEVTETVAKAVAMSGATAESANAAMVQFSQGIASGVLRGEEFNSVAEQTPALLDAIARGLNKDRSELRAMAQTGQLTSKLIIDALEKSADGTDAMFGRMTLGISATFNKLRNEATKWVGEMNEASGASSTLVAGMNLLAENLDGAIFLAGTAALASLTKTIILSTTATIQDAQAKAVNRAATIAEMQAIVANMSATTASTQAKLASATASVAEAQAHVANATSTKAAEIAKGVLLLRERQLAAATAANTAATVAETAATNTLATATSRLNIVKQGALGLFGGGAGLIAMGVSAAAMYFLLSKNTDKSADAALEHSKYIDMDRIAIEKLNSAQKDDAIEKMTESLRLQNEELKIAQREYARRLGDVVSTVSSSQGIQEVLKILTDVRMGVISFAEATDQLNKKDLLTPEQRAGLLESEKRYQEVYVRANEAATGLRNFGQQAKIAGSQANNTAIQQNILNASVEGTADAYEAASAAIEKYNNKLLSSIKYSAYVKERSKYTNLDQAKAEGEYYQQTGKAPDLGTQKAIAAELAGKKSISDLEDALKEKEQARRKAAKDQANDDKKNAKEATKQIEDRHKEYLDYLKLAKSESEQIGEEWAIFMARFDEFGGGDTAQMEKVTAIFRERLAEAAIELNNYKETYSDYWQSEADGVNKYYQNQEYLLRHSTKVTKDERAKMREDLMSGWKNELDLIQVKWEIERVESRKAFLAEKDYLDQITQLRLKQIDLAPDLSQDQKNIRNDAVVSDHRTQTQAIDTQALDSYIEVMRSQGTNPQEDLIETLDAQRAIVMEAYDQGVIDKETYYSALNTLDNNYFTNSAQMWATTWSGSLDGWASFFKNVQGETSSAYKAIFAMQKGFSIATAALNISKAISDGWATGVTVYDKMAAVATIITQTGSILSDISSITMGFKDGGYTGSIGKNNVAGLVHGNEFVMPAESTSRYRNQLESMRNGTYGEDSGSGGNTFNFVNNFYSDGSSSSEQADANTMGAALNAAMKKFIMGELAQGGSISQFVKGNSR